MLVGLDARDDAAVVRLSGSDALVLTLDFFTPVVDDAYTWGRIAAANAVSDVYAMGGRPLVALNIAGWPRDTLPLELLAEVLRGGLETAGRAGMAVVGGHTVDDPEPKYGMCVVGRADPERLLTLDAARPGDVLVLTKPVGTGIVTTAIKREEAPTAAVEAAVASMVHLSDAASQAVLAAGVRACTDVTGFGLLGHLHRMLLASGASAEVTAGAVPLLPGARDLAARGLAPGGTQRNLDAMAAHVDWTATGEVDRILLCDAQTSGGLLAACPPEAVDGLLGSLSGEPAAAVIGRVLEGPAGRIGVTG